MTDAMRPIAPTIMRMMPTASRLIPSASGILLPHADDPAGDVGPAGSDASRRAPPGDSPVDQQGEDGTDDRSDEAGGLERPLVEILVEEQVAEEPTDERTDDAENDRLDERHGIGARHEEAGEVARHDPHDDQVQDETEHWSRLPEILPPGGSGPPARTRYPGTPGLGTPGCGRTSHHTL